MECFTGGKKQLPEKCRGHVLFCWQTVRPFRRHFVQRLIFSNLSEIAYTYLTSYVRSLPPSSPAAKPAALQLIATALRLPTIFDFSSLYRLENVQSLKSHELYTLLQIFSEKGIPEYKAWQEKNMSSINEFSMFIIYYLTWLPCWWPQQLLELDASQLERKMQLLILSELGFSKVGQQVSYAEIAAALKIDNASVEKWAIDGMNTLKV